MSEPTGLMRCDDNAALHDADACTMDPFIDGGLRGHWLLPGDPCNYCGKPVPAADMPNRGGPCTDCWTSLDGMALADIKALFAADESDGPQLSIDPGRAT